MRCIRKLIVGIISLGALMGQRVLAESPLTDSGAGSSGGGFLITDQENPWWVQNKSEVHYCISIDEEGFKLERKTAEKHIDAAFRFWKKSFAPFIQAPIIQAGLEPPHTKVLVATQNFILKSCSEPVDLVFQLGYLTEDQRLSIPDLDSVLSVAMRTSYDRKNLHGKGYIYATPTQGPHKYGGTPLSYDPWTVGNGSFFFMTMLHELGHVFGLQHNVDGAQGLMGTKLVNNLFSLGLMAEPISEEIAKMIAEDKMGEFFRVSQVSDLVVCRGLSKSSALRPMANNFEFAAPEEPKSPAVLFDKVFGLDSNKDLCQKISIENQTFRVYGGPDQNSLTMKGEAKMSPIDLMGETWGAGLVHLWIPQEHTDFFKIKEPIFNHFSAAYHWSQELKGDFQLVENGQRTPIAFELKGPQQSSLSSRITAVVDGKLISNLLRGK